MTQLFTRGKNMATKDESKEVVSTEEVKSPEVFSSKEEFMDEAPYLELAMQFLGL